MLTHHLRRAAHRARASFLTPPHALRALSTSTTLPRVSVVFGSQSGTANLFAEQLAEELEDQGVVAETPLVCTGNEFLSGIESGQVNPPDALVVLASCYGRGEPTDNFKQFYDCVTAEKYPPQLHGVPTAVFGLGSSRTHCDYYNVVGQQVDESFHTIGVPKLTSLGLGDDSNDIDEDFENWQEVVVDAIKSHSFSSQTEGADPAPTTTSDAPIDTSDTHDLNHSIAPELLKGSDMVVTREGGFNKLTTNPHDASDPSRCVYEMWFNALDGRSFEFDTGDYVLIRPENAPERVDLFCDRLGLDQALELPKFAPALVGTTATSSSPTLGSLLRYCFEIDAFVTKNAPQLLAKELRKINEDALADALLQYKTNKDKYNELVSEHVTLDEFVASLTQDEQALVREILKDGKVVERLLSTALGRLSDRCYSISSTKRQGEQGEMKITFRYLTYSTPKGKPVVGVNSRFLLHCMETPERDVVNLKVRNGTFKLCTDPTSPLIMVAGGIGIAPFHAFIADREESMQDNKTLGPGLLFYGTRNQFDDAYLESIVTALEKGVLSEVRIAHSDQDKPDNSTGNSNLVVTGNEFVHEAFIRDGRRIWELLDQNRKTRIYVCGGASGFGEAMVEAVEQIARDHGGLNPEEAREFFRMLIRENRYLEDLAD